MAVTEMKTNEDKKVELTITVDAETFGKAVDEVFKKNVKRMTVPGFRRGKAPRRMIEKLYGEGVFYEEAVNNTYPAAYDAAVEEKGIEPGRPRRYRGARRLEGRLLLQGDRHRQAGGLHRGLQGHRGGEEGRRGDRRRGRRRALPHAGAGRPRDRRGGPRRHERRHRRDPISRALSTARRSRAARARNTRSSWAPTASSPASRSRSSATAPASRSR